jgi:hypothetical protein
VSDEGLVLWLIEASTMWVVGWCGLCATATEQPAASPAFASLRDNDGSVEQWSLNWQLTVNGYIIL